MEDAFVLDLREDSYFLRDPAEIVFRLGYCSGRILQYGNGHSQLLYRSGGEGETASRYVFGETMDRLIDGGVVFCNHAYDHCRRWVLAPTPHARALAERARADRIETEEAV